MVSAARFLSIHLRGRRLGDSVLDLASERSSINHVAINPVSREENVERERNRPLYAARRGGKLHAIHMIDARARVKYIARGIARRANCTAQVRDA